MRLKRNDYRALLLLMAMLCIFATLAALWKGYSDGYTEGFEYGKSYQASLTPYADGSYFIWQGGE